MADPDDYPVPLPRRSGDGGRIQDLGDSGSYSTRFSGSEDGSSLLTQSVASPLNGGAGGWKVPAGAGGGGLASAPETLPILVSSVNKQEKSRMRYQVRLADLDMEEREKQGRLQMLRDQQRRRDAWAAADAESLRRLKATLEHVVQCVHDRQTNLRPEGYQTFAFPNGDVYEGNWKNCLMHGKGCMRRLAGAAGADPVRGDIYEGQWFVGQRCGNGMYHCPSFDIFYNGAWLDDKRHGKGELIEPEGFFVGEFVENRIQGYGEYVYQDGHVYKGEWVNGLYEGTGAYLYPGGEKYDGGWRGGCEHGRGTKTYFNGDTYVGEWRYGLRHGLGVYTGQALVIDGQWEFGAVAGEATCNFSDGSSYSGMWKNGRYHGIGTFTSVTSAIGMAPPAPGAADDNGAGGTTSAAVAAAAAGSGGGKSAYLCSYTGEFREGLRHGEGFYHSDLATYDGEWFRGVKEGVGSMSFRGGGTLHGRWANDVPSGDCVYVMEDGTARAVFFVDGVCTSVIDQQNYSLVDVGIKGKDAGGEDEEEEEDEDAGKDDDASRDAPTVPTTAAQPPPLRSTEESESPASPERLTAAEAESPRELSACEEASKSASSPAPPPLRAYQVYEEVPPLYDEFADEY